MMVSRTGATGALKGKTRLIRVRAAKRAKNLLSRARTARAGGGCEDEQNRSVASQYFV